MAESSHESAPVEVAAEPVATPAAFSALPAPRSMALARSASAMGNQAFGQWARSAGAAGEPLPSLSAHQAWGNVLARDPDPAAMAPGGDTATDDGPEPILVKGLKFGQQLLDGEIPETGGELSKTVNAKLGKYKANFGPYNLNVPLFPGLYAAFGAGGAMSANADASLTLAGSNSPRRWAPRSRRSAPRAPAPPRARSRLADGGRAHRRPRPGQPRHRRPGHARLRRRRRRQVLRRDQALQAQGRERVAAVERGDRLRGQHQGLADRLRQRLLRVPGPVDLQGPVRQVQDRRVDAGRGGPEGEGQDAAGRGPDGHDRPVGRAAAQAGRERDAAQADLRGEGEGRVARAAGPVADPRSCSG